MKPQSPLSDCHDNNQYASTHFQTMSNRNSISIVSRCGLRRASVFYTIQKNVMNKKKEKLNHLHLITIKPNFNSPNISSNLFAPEPDSYKSSFRSSNNLIADFNVYRSKKETCVNILDKHHYKVILIILQQDKSLSKILQSLQILENLS